MKNKEQTCIHLQFITKQNVKNSFQKISTNNCNIHQQSSTSYLCLSCGSYLCNTIIEDKTCFKNHCQQNNHYYVIQLSTGSIWCNLCQNTIQNMIFQFKQSPQIAKLRRFCQFVNQFWSLYDIKNKSTIKMRKGLVNIGNTCFINSVLQCMGGNKYIQQLYSEMQFIKDKIIYKKKIIKKQIQYFYDDILQKKHEQNWNIVRSKKQKRHQLKINNRKIIKDTKLNNAFKQLVQVLNDNSKVSFQPIKIVNLMGEIQYKYKHKEQQDSQQFLLILIDSLCQGQKLSLLQQPQRYKQVQSLLGYQKLSPTQNIFGFYLLDQVQCLGCKQITRTLNLSYNLSISVNQKENQSNQQIEYKQKQINIQYWQPLQYPQDKQIPDLLKGFFKFQRLNNKNNFYTCNKCKALSGIRKYYIVSPPQILIISFKRFNANLKKADYFLKFPTQLDISSIVMSQTNYKYNLSGIIVHVGDSISSGHYICFIKIQQNWYMCSDQKVQVVTENYIKIQKAYILFYQLKQS